MFARIGGDEFAFFLFDTGVADARGIAEKILAATQQFSLEWKGDHFQVGASIGLAPVVQGDKSYAPIYQRADKACYQAKHSGRNRVYVEDCAGDGGCNDTSMADNRRVNGTAV